MVQRFLDFAHEQRNSFFPSAIGYGERTRIRAVLPTVFRQLGADPLSLAH
jgi:hypothetical protein